MASDKGVAQLRSDEGMSRFAEHILVQGKREKNKTIGHGYNLDKPSAKQDLLDAGVLPSDVEGMMRGDIAISDEQADALFQRSLSRAEERVRTQFKNYGKLPQDVQDALVNMSYQLGGNLKEFKDLNRAVADGDIEGIHREMLDSQWAKQTPNRAGRLAKQVKGHIPEKKKSARAVPKANPRKDFQEQAKRTMAREFAQMLDKRALAKQFATMLKEVPKNEDE